MEINCWTGPGDKIQVKAPDVPAAEVAALSAAIRAAREGDGTGSTVLWERPRASAGLRAAARLVLGFGCTVAAALVVALVVLGPALGSVLMVTLVAVLVVGGSFVAVVWTIDVGLTVHADGTLRRAGWGGESTVDLRRYERVTVND